MSRGLFLSLDGLDGAGKSTQCRLLAEWLRGRGLKVTACTDPGGTEIGRILRSLLLDHHRHMTPACEAFLFMASRSQLVAEIIRPVLADGHVVVCDRFLLANVVYQGHAGGLPPEKLWEVGLLATQGLQPDMTFVLDLPIAEARGRRQGPSDRLESRDESFHERVRNGFLTEVRGRLDLFRLVDATLPIEHVHEVIRLEVEKLLIQRHMF